MLTKTQAIDEAKRQKEALRTIGSWRRYLFIATACFLTLAIFGLRSSGAAFVLGIVAAALAGIGLLLTFVVNLSIRNGHRNVEKILESLQ